MPWLLTAALVVSLMVILVVKAPILRNSTQRPISRSISQGAAMAGLTPLVGMISQNYLTGPAHYIGLALQGAMIGFALVLIWKGNREIRAHR